MGYENLDKKFKHFPNWPKCLENWSNEKIKVVPNWTKLLKKWSEIIFRFLTHPTPSHHPHIQWENKKTV